MERCLVFMTGRLNRIKIPNFPKLVHRFKAIPIKIATELFVDIYTQLIIKCNGKAEKLK